MDVTKRARKRRKKALLKTMRSESATPFRGVYVYANGDSRFGADFCEAPNVAIKPKPTHLEQFTQIFEGAGLVTVTEPIEHNGETKGITLFAYRKGDRENPINLLHFKTDGGLAT